MNFSSEATGQSFCVIGAGPAGLTATKNFRQLGLPVECLEREDDVGGTWYYGSGAGRVYRSTHLVSSKKLTQYSDFAMPDEFPAYPSHEQALAYLRGYARTFDLYRSIRLNTAVERAWRADGGGWIVRCSDGSERRYRGLIVANGHNWDPRLPKYPGSFSGQTMHSAAYRTPDVLEGRRVLVVGAGNSGCDIAVEAAQRAAQTFHSTRRGYYYLPKFLLGKPIDLCGERLLRWRIPLWLRRRITARLVKLALGNPQDYGLPKPDHRFWETHPIINSQMLYYVGHGEITPKPDVARFEDDQVHFADGSAETIDLVVYATGYRISIPFLDPSELNLRGERPELHLNIFHPQHDDLFVLGLIQPDSGQWGLLDLQAQLVARYLRALDASPPAARRFRERALRESSDLGGGIRYVNSARHLLEVEHFSYRQRLQKLIADFPPTGREPG